jgi:hypothetical protein
LSIVKPYQLVSIAAVVAVMAYWIGLRGPFILDDQANLSAIPEWLAGRLGLASLMFDRGAGVLGRPVSMASLALNAWIGGYSPYSFKLGNLIVHLLCGAAIFGLLRRMLSLKASLHPHAAQVAAVTSAIWLLHPLHASTVLYAVQRMAQVSTLLTLLGLGLYLLARERLTRAPSPVATSAILLGVPAITALAFLGKENGALLPLLCCVLELSWFRDRPRPWPAAMFVWGYVLVPALLALLGMALAPARFLGGYIGRDFTLYERVLSQGRALCDYIWKLAAPDPAQMGVYTDDFPISTGWMEPPTTLASVAVLVALTAAAWRVRNRLPAVCFGWFFFLAAHAVESTILPLELYFEHRNYLPSVGLLIALVSLTAFVGDVMAHKGIRTERIAVIFLPCVLLVLTFGTHGRARVWADERLIAESSLLAHPHSLRANVALMTTALRYGDRARASGALEAILTSPVARHRSLGHAFRLLTECQLDHKGRPDDLQAFVEQTPLPLTVDEQQPFYLLYAVTADQPCQPFTDRDFGEALARLTDRSVAHYGAAGDRWHLRYQAASYLLRARDWHGALTQARLGWRPEAAPPAAMPLVLAQLRTGDLRGAKQTMREVTVRADPTNFQEQAALRWLREQVESAGTR